MRQTVDYILFAKKSDVTPVPNANEVRDFRYFAIEDVQALVDSAAVNDSGVNITPWFGLIVKHFLFKWWRGIDDLSSFIDPESIHEIK